MTSGWALGRFWGSIRDFYKELNPATLTGAVDVIVVEQPNGDYVCSPFHVRFGKMGVLRSREKVVEMMVNDVPSTIQMKLSDTGEAFFVEGVEGGDEVPLHLATSPLPISNAELMKRGLDNLRASSDPADLKRESSAPPSAPEHSSAISHDPNKPNAIHDPNIDEREKDNSISPPPMPDNTDSISTSQLYNYRRENTIYQSCTNELPGLDKKTLRQLLMSRRRSDFGNRAGSRLRSRSWHGETGSSHGRKQSSTPVIQVPASRRVRDLAVLRHSRSYVPSSLRKFSFATPIRTSTTNGRMSTRVSANNWCTPPDATPALSPGASCAIANAQDQQKVQFTLNEDIFQMDGDDDDDASDSDRADSGLSKSLGTVDIGKGFGDAVKEYATKMTPAVITNALENVVDAVADAVDEMIDDEERNKTVFIADETEQDKEVMELDSDRNSDNEDGGTRSSSPAIPETEAEKIQRVIQEGDALGKVLGQAGGSDSDTSVWKWVRKNSQAKLEQKQLSTDEAQTGWNLFGFMRRSDRPQDNDGGIYLGDLLKDEKVDPSLADRYLMKRPRRKSLDASPTTATVIPISNGCIEKSQRDVVAANEFNPAPSPRSDFGYGSKPSSITGDDNRRWFFDEGRFHELLGDMAVSSCGGLDRGEITDELFNAHVISYDQLNANPDLLFSPDLVIRMSGKYYNWKVAGPILVSLLLFQQPLSESAVNTLMNKYQPKPTTHDARDPIRKGSASTSGVSSYFWWRRATSADPPVKTEELKADENPTIEQHSNEVEQHSPPIDRLPPLDAVKIDSVSAVDQRKSSFASSFEFDDRGALSDSELEETRKTTTKARYKKTLLLTSDQLKSLNLKRGVANKACFSVTTKYQGTTVCECEIWLWRYDDKIIISDIDGTITKSDVLGHILPRVGGGFWAHIGVAELFKRIAANDYKILYLTARAIGMATQTKEYLMSIRQDRYSLPGGPLLLSPTSVFNALHREVIEKKPEIFKMSCLRDVVSLFPSNVNPFYAGFGNRTNDTVAYTAAGVPPHRIYIIDPTGRVEFVDKKLEFSYPRISDLVDHIFPPLRTVVRRASDVQMTTPTPTEYNNAQYWRSAVREFDVDLTKFPKPTTPISKTNLKSSASNTNSIAWSKKK